MHLLERLKLKDLTILSVDKKAEQTTFLPFTTGKSISWYNYCGEPFGSYPPKLTTHLL